MTMEVVPRSLGSWSTEGLGELQKEIMVLSSQNAAGADAV